MGGKSGGLIFDDSKHYIDHLAPFCAEQGWPLIVCEGTIAEMCNRYYPDLQVIQQSIWDLQLPETIVSCYPAKWLRSLFPSTASKKLLWLPHGHSDKGWCQPSFEVLEKETALVYGHRMEEAIRVKNPHINTVRIGNFRLRYWKKQKNFYDRIIQEELPPLQEKNTYLYAPTWKDREGNGSCDEFLEPLLYKLPPGFTLIIKPHPNTEHQRSAQLRYWQMKWGRKKNVFFLSHFPPIYPLLDRCDAYIGDMSSIGYDYLYFDRPLYLFKSQKEHPLYQAAHLIDHKTLPSIFSKKSSPNHLRKKIYKETFDHCV